MRDYNVKGNIMAFLLRAGGIDLPAPVSMSVGDEILWSSDTGRALDGTMLGDVIAEKKNISLSWGITSEEDLVLITKQLATGFFPLEFHDDGMDMTISSYRGTLTKEILGNLDDGTFWYRSISVSIIQQ